MRAKRKQGYQAILAGVFAFLTIQGSALAWKVTLHPALIDVPFQMRVQSAFRGAEKVRDTRIVCLGSSRMMYGLHADILSRELSYSRSQKIEVLNFGFPGCGPIVSKIYLQRLLRNNLKPDVLILEIMPGLLTHSRGEEGRPMEWNRFHPCRFTQEEIRSIEETITIPVSTDTPLDTVSALCPLYGDRIGLMIRSLPSWLPEEYVFDLRAPCDSHAHASPPGIVYRAGAREKAFLQMRQQYEPYLDSRAALDRIEEAAIAEIQAICEREGIVLMALLMPEARPFRDLCSTALEAELQRFLDRQFRTDRVLLARDWMADDCFWDGHHLLPEGGAIFTSRLVQKLRALEPVSLSPMLQASLP